MSEDALILVVDDDARMRMILMRGIASLGYTNIAVAIDGQDALEQLGQMTADLVISDRQMPRLDGFNLLTSMKSNPVFAGIPFILMSTLMNAQEAARGMRLGAAVCISKAELLTNEGILLKVIRQALETKGDTA